MFLFFQIQGVLNAFILSIPTLVVSFNPSTEGLNLLEIIAVSIWVIGNIGEAKADLDLKNFISDPYNKGKVCRNGLWNYSRHPNYFFEWIIWISYFLFALNSPFGIVTIACPITMLYLLWYVTGIPLTEKISVRSKGEIYKRYQREVNAFFLAPPQYQSN